jgi:hypothetical protein
MITGVAHFQKKACQNKTLPGRKLQYLLGNFLKSC